MAVQWIEKGLGVVPTEFESLLSTLVQDGELTAVIRDLLKRKSRALESEYADAIPVLNKYFDNEIARLEGGRFSKRGKQADPENLNRYFRAKLLEVWADAQLVVQSYCNGSFGGVTTDGRSFNRTAIQSSSRDEQLGGQRTPGEYR